MKGDISKIGFFHISLDKDISYLKLPHPLGLGSFSMVLFSILETITASLISSCGIIELSNHQIRE